MSLWMAGATILSSVLGGNKSSGGKQQQTQTRVAHPETVAIAKQGRPVLDSLVGQLGAGDRESTGILGGNSAQRSAWDAYRNQLGPKGGVMGSLQELYAPAQENAVLYGDAEKKSVMDAMNTGSMDMQNQQAMLAQHDAQGILQDQYRAGMLNSMASGNAGINMADPMNGNYAGVMNSAANQARERERVLGMQMREGISAQAQGLRQQADYGVRIPQIFAQMAAGSYGAEGQSTLAALAPYLQSMSAIAAPLAGAFTSTSSGTTTSASSTGDTIMGVARGVDQGVKAYEKYTNSQRPNYRTANRSTGGVNDGWFE